MTRRAGILLEVMLALALLISAALVILGTLDRSAAGLKLAHDQIVATNLARSAISKIEAGIENAQNLNGPVAPWSDSAEEDIGEFEDAPPPVTGWELEIRTEPSNYAGLSLVTVVATRRSIAGDKVLASCTLRQLVRLGAQGTAVSAGASR